MGVYKCSALHCVLGLSFDLRTWHFQQDCIFPGGITKARVWIRSMVSMGKWRQSIVIPWLSSLQISSAAYPWPMSWTRKCLLSMEDFSAVMVWNYLIYVQLIASGSLLMKVTWSCVLSWHILGWILYSAWFWIGLVGWDSDSFCCLVQIWKLMYLYNEVSMILNVDLKK